MNFEGCVAVVSHDRYFLNRVCTHILAFEDDGNVTFTPGNYSYYAEKRQQRLQQEKPVTEKPQASSAQPVARPQGRRLKWAEQKELENMEESIMQAEEEVAEIEAIFSLPDFHAKYGTQTAELTQKLTDAKEKVSALYARWEELENIRDGHAE